MFSFSMFAEHVPLEKAKKVALNFYYEKYNQYESNIDFTAIRISNTTTKVQEQEIYYYVFSFTDGGFVIVPADDCLSPVLGYSFKHDYVSDNQPPNVQYWFQQFEEQVKYARENNLLPEKQITDKWNHYNTNDISTLSSSQRNREVEPLLTTLWDQGWPFNINCPSGVGGTALTGCVATAYAQMLYYWRFPLHGSGYHCYEHPVYGELCADFENTYYRWDEMCDDPKKANTAIGELMYQMGVALDMNYGPSSSGAMGYPEQVEPYFRISTDYDSLRHDFYTNTEWRNILLEQLDLNYPVSYIGFSPDSSVGHMWVCDGYQDTSHLHMNWGWGGLSNGYYTLDNLQGYNTYQFLGVNFYPDTTNLNYPNYASGADTLYTFEGSITDGSGPVKNYLNNTQASWLIDPQNIMDSVTNITLEIKRCQLGNGDYIKIYDGGDNTATLIVEITGNTIPEPIVSSGNQLFVEFSSNGENTASGFYIVYRTEVPVFCSGQNIISDSSNWFNDGSDNFYYNNSSMCMWFLQPAGCDSTLTLYFDYFYTEAENDYLRIIDPQTQDVLAQYSGNYEEAPPPVTSESGSMLLLFATNSSIRDRGWSAYYGQHTGITDTKEPVDLMLYPNPSHNQFTLSITMYQPKNVVITLYSMVGKKVMEKDIGLQSAGKLQQTIDTSNLPEDAYFLRLNVGNEVFIRKVIVR